MKFIAFLTIFLVFTVRVFASEMLWNPPGSFVQYGNGEHTWVVGTVTSDSEAHKARDRDFNWSLFGKQIHPFQWQRLLDERLGTLWGDEYMWYIHGSAENLNKEISQFDPRGESSFVWVDAPKGPIRLHCVTGPDGRGRVKIFQGDQIIASMRTTTSANAAVRLATGTYQIDYKKSGHRSSEVLVRNAQGKKEGAWMGKVLHINAKNEKGENRGIYLHAGSLGTNSIGCYRISKAVIDWVYNRADPKTYKTEISISSL